MRVTRELPLEGQRPRKYAWNTRPPPRQVQTFATTQLLSAEGINHAVMVLRFSPDGKRRGGVIPALLVFPGSLSRVSSRTAARRSSLGPIWCGDATGRGEAA